METYGEKLKAARKAKKLRQEDTAAALNICHSAYTKYETGRADPPLKSVVLLADLYGITLDELLR